MAGNAAVRNEWAARPRRRWAGRAPRSASPYEIALNAEINPTSTFTLDTITHNKKNGHCHDRRQGPNPGELTGAGRGVKVASAAITRKR